MTQMINESVTCNVSYCCDETFINVTKKKKDSIIAARSGAIHGHGYQSEGWDWAYLGKLLMRETAVINRAILCKLVFLVAGHEGIHTGSNARYQPAAR